MVRLALSIALLLPAVAVPASPIAEVVCADTARMEDRLQHQLGVTRTAVGLRGPEEVMEIWTGREGDWTLVMRYATGTSCIVAMGEHWNSALPKQPT